MTKKDEKLHIATDGHIKTPEEKALISAYLLFYEKIKLESWNTLKPEEVIYLLDHFPRDRFSEITELLQNLIKALKDKKTFRKWLNENASRKEKELIAEFRQLQKKIEILKKQEKQAREMAEDAHGSIGQSYGDKPYSFHLRKVKKVLERFGFGRNQHIWGYELSVVAWLHDVVEDTQVSLKEIESMFGNEVAGIIEAITQLPGEDPVSYFTRIAKNEKAKIVKFADRIANVEESLSNAKQKKPNKMKKYYSQWPEFSKKLFSGEEELRPMWEYLQKLIKEPL